MLVGRKGQVNHCLEVNHGVGLAGSGWSFLLEGGSFSFQQGMLCPQGLLPEIRDKGART